MVDFEKPSAQGIGINTVNENRRTQTRPMQAVEQLVIRGAADVFVTHGEPSMTVIADCPEDVLTEICGGTLTISTRPTARRVDGCIHIDGDVTIVSGYSLQVFHGHIGNVAGGDIVINGDGHRATVEITLPGLPEVSISGACNLCLERLNQDAIELEISGSGTVTLTGRVKHLDATISGAGDVNAKKLEAESASLNVSGAGKIKALVKSSLKARVSGAGGIKVWGDPALRDTRVSGVGDIRFK
jgi:hypothetical protein